MRLDEGRTADGDAQGNEAALFWAQGEVPNPDLRLGRKLQDSSRQHSRRIPNSCFGGIQAESSPLPDQLLEAAVEQCNPVG